MIHLLRGVLARAVSAGVWALVLLAVLVSAVRLSLPLSDRYRETVAATLSERLDRPVQVGAMSLRLAGWSPRLRLDDLVVGTAGGGAEALRLRALELDLDVAGSLRSRSTEARALTLVGANLAVRRQLDGRIRIEGLSALRAHDPQVMERFMRRGRLNLEDSEVRLIDDRLPGELPRLTAVRVRLDNAGGRHLLELAARPVAAQSTGPDDCPADAQVRVLADLSGEWRDPSAWGGTVYLDLGGADLTALVPPSLLGARAAGSESVVVESWLRLSGGALEEALARVTLRGLRFEVPAPNAQTATQAVPADRVGRKVVIDRLRGLLRVAPSDGGWGVGLRDLALSLGGIDLPDLDLDLQVSSQGRPERVALVAERFDLGLVEHLAQVFPGPLPSAVTELLARHPRGSLSRLALDLESREKGPASWRVLAIGTDLGLDQAGKMPGLEGLSARLRADQDGGTLHLGSEALRLDAAPVFDHVLALDQFSGVLSWDLGPDGALHLNGRNLVLENPDLAGRARFTLDLPVPGDEPGPGPFLDLRASFHDGNARNLRPYLPVGIIHPNLVRWLSRAVADGRVTQADLVLRGPLRDYPFRGHQGRFDLTLEVDGGVLHYLEGWPPIEDLAATLRFLNQGLTITAESGRILESALGAAEAAIPDLWGARRLKIRGETAGPLSDGLRVLGETPLARQLGPLARVLEVEGRSRLELDLDVPLARGEPLRVDGRITWPGPAEVALKGTPLRLTDLQGDLRFAVDSLSAEAVSARLWGRPVSLTIKTRGAGDADAAVTEIRAQGRSPVADLAARFPSPAWTLASGDLGWAFGVDLRNADLKQASPPLGLRLDSDLSGVALDLPAPLGKAAAETRSVALTGSLVPGLSLALSGGVGNLGLILDLDLRGGAARLDRGRVRLGAAAPAADSSGLVVDGALDVLDLAAWSDWWKSVQPRILPAAAPAASTGSAPIPRAVGLTSADLRIGDLRLGQTRLTDARVQAAPRDGGWDLRLDSKELAGRLTLPAPPAKTPLDLSLERLDVAALMGPRDQTAPALPTRQSKWRGDDLPAVDLRVADLRWGEATLGRFSLELRPEPGGVQVPLIELSGPGETRVTGNASWVDVEGEGRSRLALQVQSADTGPLLSALDYTAALSQAPLEATLRLEWPAPLTQFSLERSQGQIDFKVGAGRLLEVEPGVGRVFGFLNLGALSRRLSLDFTDLYQQGFSFERMEADIRVAGGRAELRRFDIEGPASTIRVSGFTDLRARTFDQTVTVEPNIGSSVALATAVAGGPVVGAAVLLMDKVAGGAIDKLGSYRYRVTGPWLNPEIRRLGWEPFSGQEPSEDSSQASPGPAANGAGAVKVPGSPAGVQPAAPKTRGENLFLD